MLDGWMGGRAAGARWRDKSAVALLWRDKRLGYAKASRWQVIRVNPGCSDLIRPKKLFL